MKQKKEATIFATACDKVKGFSALMDKFRKNLSVAGKSESTFRNYSLHIATMALHFERLPTLLEEDQITDYLYLLQQQHNTPSRSYFKHTVYGLRAIFKIEGIKSCDIKLPSIKKSNKLPVVLSKEEVKSLLKAPELLKHRILLGLLYECGLRCFEVRNIKLSDIDYDRSKLHVRLGKGKKDRYLPIGEHIKRGIRKYILAENPEVYLFNGQPMEDGSGGDFDRRYSQRGVQWAVKQACKKAKITKEVSVHTLRHTYATHLVEDGLDIVTVKDLMGHENIQTTMIYLQLAQSGRIKPFGPLDRLYQ